MPTLSSNNNPSKILSRKISLFFNEFKVGEKVLLNSGNVFDKSQSSITNYIEHYKNIYADPSKFTKRRVDYGRMRVVDEKYRKEIERWKSFKDFPLHLKDLVKSLSKSGFYFIGNIKEPDKVKCIYCQGILSNWKRNDIPERDHKRSFPTCPFILNLNVGNEPFKEFGEKLLSVDPDLKNTNGYISFNVISFLDKESHYLDDSYVDIETREKTFKNFEKLKNFALEGLYVLEKGKDYFMKCYQCNRETEILNNIENLLNNLLHNKNCKYFTLSAFDQMKMLTVQGNSEITTNCKVEYSITDEEIEARMDSRRATEVEKMFGKRDVIKHLIATKLKVTGKDYETNLEIIEDLRNFNGQMINEQNSDLLDIIFFDTQCVVCLDSPVSVVFLLCGHMITCESCSKSFNNCPLCRKLIEKRVLNIQVAENLIL